MPEQLLTRSEVARRLGVTPHTLYRWTRRGQFPAPIKLGHRSVRYEPAVVEEGLGRLVRVSQDFTCTARQLEGLRAKLAAHFARRPALTVAEFKALAGVSRKWAVPLLEHCDRVGWTVRAGDERKAGGRLTAPPR